MEETWNDKFEYLKESRFLFHNDDYLEFLVKNVWRITKPIKIVDFGCGYGFMGCKLLPLLPAGSSYTGIDGASELIGKAKEIFRDLPYAADFKVGSVYDSGFEDGAFDMAVCHTVLMHVDKPREALAEMVRVTGNGGLVVTCEANRTAHTALFYLDEENAHEPTPVRLFQKMNESIRRSTGKDYDIGIKLPVYMDHLGLADIESRMSDAVRYLSPSTEPAFRERLFTALCDDGLALPELNDDLLSTWKRRLLSYGAVEEEVENHIAAAIRRDFKNKGKAYHTVYPGLLTFTWGKVAR